LERITDINWIADFRPEEHFDKQKRVRVSSKPHKMEVRFEKEISSTLSTADGNNGTVSKNKKSGVHF
jgi:hypothetical protein